MSRSTTNFRDIKATSKEVYDAFLTPSALEFFQAPGEMTAKISQFEPRVGGGYQMTLSYPEGEMKMKGKTSEKEDKFSAKFVELHPHTKIIESVQFDSEDAAFSGEMIMEIKLEQIEMGTRVTFVFNNIPKGIDLKDNEAGTLSTLEKLAEYLEPRSELKG